MFQIVRVSLQWDKTFPGNPQNAFCEHLLMYNVTHMEESTEMLSVLVF